MYSYPTPPLYSPLHYLLQSIQVYTHAVPPLLPLAPTPEQPPEEAFGLRLGGGGALADELLEGGGGGGSAAAPPLRHTRLLVEAGVERVEPPGQHRRGLRLGHEWHPAARHAAARHVVLGGLRRQVQACDAQVAV
eukprot:CAMPEP_0118954460 /NCGR_PEP_ID=MMETSP1169-20130426/58255_1 /TAXON_ID=36882 /ORGANISM="Pyramimonas obovata, Strain CCMP722" /LENGTH=134 /DNA_ID=CAMNT_0006902089 /DNA_START=83 /DNA_END=484 /DNA_ORIENTATION=+